MDRMEGLSSHRGIRLLSSSTTTSSSSSSPPSTSSREGRGGQGMSTNERILVDTLQNSYLRRSMARILLPWIAMGLAMGIGYYGIESLLLWLGNKNKLNNNSIRKKKNKNSLLREQLVRHVQQMRAILSFSNAKKWLLRCWTLPILYHEVFLGLFVAVLPSPSEKNNNNEISSKVSSRVLNPRFIVPKDMKQEEGDAFLTLPPQLHPRLPSNTCQSGPRTSTTTPKKERYLEMLLHNVSHTDLVLGLDVLSNLETSSSSASSSLKSMCLCRPRFSAFDMYCRKLLEALQQEEGKDNNNTHQPADIILVPQYQRAQNDPRYTIQPSDRPHVATGFYWKNNISATETSHNKNKRNKNPRVIPISEALADLRVRGKDMTKLDPYINDNRHDQQQQQQPRQKSNLDYTDVPQSPRTSFIQEQAIGDDDASAPSSPSTTSWNLVTTALDYGAALTKTSKNTNVTTDSDTMLQQPSPPLPDNKEDILVELKAIFFPLLATLLPRWHAQIVKKYNRQEQQQKTKENSNYEIHQVLVLVTGVGTPRNYTHSITGNSTQVLADLMELFLAKIYPDITVVKIHSDTNIFRYDDNILFVQQHLMPTVNAYRDAHATQAPYPHEIYNVSSSNTADNTVNKNIGNYGYMQQLQPNAQDATNSFDVNWKKSFAVTLSFADGSPARTHAIQTALRIFRPIYFHIWQLKTFWHERKIVDDDVEIHSFEEMEASPALESSELQGELAHVVEEMKAFRDEMAETLSKKNASDFHSFWLRKTHKPVLAVLLVQSEGGQPLLYRGTNMEVSMPTGSLCAERNVIGTALASNPKLKRQDLKCIAVLAVPQPPATKSASLGPPRSSSLEGGLVNNNDNDIFCGSCISSRQNSMDESASLMTGSQMRRESIDEREEEWMLNCEIDSKDKSKITGSGVSVEETASTEKPKSQEPSTTPVRQISLFSSESSNSLVDMIKKNPLGAVKQSTSTAAAAAGGVVVKEKRTVIVRSNNNDVDLNPLKPCGACHEWLKKIAECNPYFQIMTFTDADCNGVYITPCQE